MMRLVDGPAAGETLAIRRAPILLRVAKNTLARNKERVWDALNDLEDVAKPHETLHLYMLMAKPQMVHLKMANRRASGFYAMGFYKFLPEQPDDATMRDNAKWSAWCDANEQRLRPAWAAKAE